MVDLKVPVEGVALDALDAFLSSDQSPPDSMMLSDLDGFLTAIAIGPELIMPSEWLPVIWGDGEPVFTDEAEMQAVLGGILSRYNQIRHEITSGTFEPILWSDADGTAIGADWAEGFMQGVGLRDIRGYETRCTKGGSKPIRGQRMPGAGLADRRVGKAPSEMPSFQPYWGKPAVRNDRGDRGRRRHHSKPGPRLDPTRLSGR
jgi:hypothetical protein